MNRCDHLALRFRSRSVDRHHLVDFQMPYAPDIRDEVLTPRMLQPAMIVLIGFHQKPVARDPHHELGRAVSWPIRIGTHRINHDLLVIVLHGEHVIHRLELERLRIFRQSVRF